MEAKEFEDNPISIENLKKEVDFKNYELEIAKLKLAVAKSNLEIACKNKLLNKTKKKELVETVKIVKPESVLPIIISKNYRIPLENEESTFKMCSDILNDLVKKGEIDKNDKSISVVKIGLCLNEIGFKRTFKRISVLKVRYGYYVIEL